MEQDSTNTHTHVKRDLAEKTQQTWQKRLKYHLQEDQQTEYYEYYYEEH